MTRIALINTNFMNTGIAKLSERLRDPEAYVDACDEAADLLHRRCVSHGQRRTFDATVYPEPSRPDERTEHRAGMPGSPAGKDACATH